MARKKREATGTSLSEWSNGTLCSYAGGRRDVGGPAGERAGRSLGPKWASGDGSPQPAGSRIAAFPITMGNDARNGLFGDIRNDGDTSTGRHG